MSEPAPQPYAYGPPAALPRVPEGLAVAALVLASVYTVVEVLLLVTSFGAAEASAAAAREGADVTTVLTAYDVLSIGYAVLLPLWIVTSLFLQRARRTAEALAPGFPHQRGPAWTWLGWVVPVVGLWFPYQVVRDVVRNAWRDPWGDQRRRLNLGLWWGLWVVALFAGQIASRLLPWSGTPDADLVALLPLFHGITAAVTVVGLVLWVRIVNSLMHALKEPVEVTNVTLPL